MSQHGNNGNEKTDAEHRKLHVVRYHDRKHPAQDRVHHDDRDHHDHNGGQSFLTKAHYFRQKSSVEFEEDAHVQNTAEEKDNAPEQTSTATITKFVEFRDRHHFQTSERLDYETRRADEHICDQR